MEYIFSWSSFLFGIIIVSVSAALVVWYQPIADLMGGGASDYDRFRFWGLIGVLAGLIVMLNIHMVLLTWLLSSLFVRQ